MWLDPLDDQADNHAAFDLYDAATAWLGRRRLDSMYLTAGPRIWLWSTADTVTVTWDNRDREIEGVEAWSARWGSFSMNRETFLREVAVFHDSLIAQMSVRVGDVCTAWNRPEVKIDFDELKRDHEQRASALGNALARVPAPEDWEKVFAAIRAVGGTV